MSFFTYVPVPDDDDEQSEPTAVPSWVQPSHNEIPVAVPYAKELGRARNVMLVLERADVYAEGVKFILRVEARYPSSMTFAEREALYRALGDRHYWRDRDAMLSDSLRVGLELADGSTVDSLALTGASWEEKPEGFVLGSFGGSGQGGEQFSTTEEGYWLWPMPPAGIAKLHFAFRGIGIDEGCIDIDTAPLIAAASQVLVIPEPLLP